MDIEQFLSEWHNDSPTVIVHTSGSTGKPKPMRVEKRRMEASARITCRFLGLKEGDTALLCLPLDYIAGKMMVVRALTCGLRLVCVEPSSHPLAGTFSLKEPEQRLTLAAMVPLQVYHSLRDSVERERLKAICHLIIGGGAIDDAMAAELKDFPHAVWSTYGMTETLSHIALRRISGPDATDWYTPFEGVGLSQDSEGCLVIDAPAVHEGPLVTNDIAELRADGTFRILGRRDNVICSGGVKLQIEEIERRLHPYMPVPFMLTKTPDAKLGEQAVLLAEPADAETLLALCRRHLPRYWQPRRVVFVDRLPLTATGKPARAEALRMAREALEA